MPRDTVALAQFLLGKLVVRRFHGALAIGRIAETGAHQPHDPACHGSRSIAERNRLLFLPHGHAYVCLCYGTSYLLNIWSEKRGIGAGVLLRALELLHGMKHMQRSRGSGGSQGRFFDLAYEAGRLTAALRVDLPGWNKSFRTWTTMDRWRRSYGRGNWHKRTFGITNAAQEKLPFFVAESPYLSGARALSTGREQ